MSGQQTKAHNPSTINDFQAWMLAQIAAGTPRIGVVGGWGCGKSHFIGLACLALAQSRPDENGMVVYPRAAQGAEVFGELASDLLAPLGWQFCATLRGVQAPHWVAPNGVKVFIKGYHRPSTRDAASSNLEGSNVGWCFIDEGPAYRGAEVADMAWGRVRAGSRPFVCVLGRPSLDEWWARWAADEPGGKGRHIRVSTRVNFPFLRNPRAFVQSMTEKQRRERLDCEPQAPEGAVYDNWRPVAYPDGNLTPLGWAYDLNMRGYLAVDWGARHPAALIIVEDPALGADVIVGELNPDTTSTYQLADALWKVARPRSEWTPGCGCFAIDDGVGDKAGKALNDHTLETNFQVLAKPRSEGGFGLWLSHSYERHAKRVNITNGVEQLRDRVDHERHGRRLLATPEMWHASAHAKGVSLARAMHAYKWHPNGRAPVKDGREHPLDALRYFVCEFRWSVGAPVPWVGQGKARGSRITPGLR